ncbi:hypothetical protein OG211_14740 [Streptomyces niveus]|uniref:hypothetical protein n=1 Tax=Streptomyces niveus TaxID=193462 RepID=UPI0038643FBD|nr:hypothetical protein OG211_14740 [Streptomyces niveus]
MGQDLSLTHALDRVRTEWHRYVELGLFTDQTCDKFALLTGRFDRFAAVRGALLVSDVTTELAEEFVTAPGRSRHGTVSVAAVATMRLRRSVLATVFRTLRALDLSDADPTRDIQLPPRAPGSVRPLTDDEALQLRLHASSLTRPSRHGAVAALALAGGHSGEIGHIRVCDLDLPGDRVWLHGSAKTDPRWCPLDPWAAATLTKRAAFVSARGLDPGRAPRCRLAVSDKPASDATLQARVCTALGDLIRRTGLGLDPDVKPASITAWAGRSRFEQTGHLADAALLLGLRSLDRTAAVIDHPWHQPTRPEDAPDAR